jgi:hypothetical protein
VVFNQAGDRLALVPLGAVREVVNLVATAG